MEFMRRYPKMTSIIPGANAVFFMRALYSAHQQDTKAAAVFLYSPPIDFNRKAFVGIGLLSKYLTP